MQFEITIDAHKSIKTNIPFQRFYLVISVGSTKSELKFNNIVYNSGIY